MGKKTPPYLVVKSQELSVEGKKPELFLTKSVSVGCSASFFRHRKVLLNKYIQF